jgi:tetratricopeptide (TPR) repeat protein
MGKGSLDSLERDRIPGPRPIAAREVPLIDRIEEMNILKEAVYKAVHGEGGLVFVHGEAGIGKTRLLREVGAYARSRGVQVLYGRCPALFRMDGVPPYIIWKEVIKDYLETCTLEHLDRVIGFYPAEVAKLVPELSQKLRTIPQSFEINPDQEQNRLFEAVSQFITNISREAPLLVILDDLQWTDPSSLLLLHYLARGVQKMSLLILGAYRSTDIDDKHPLTPVLAELRRERLPQSVSLKRMSMDETSEMIKQILEQDDVPPEFCTLVFEKTRGNPFFTEEVIESLKEEGVIYEEEGRWEFKQISAIVFPESVKNIVKARFSRLDDECQKVLTLASFIGNDFTLEAMLSLTGIEENRLLEIMDRLIKAGFVKHTVIRGEDICSFADIIMRDVVHEEVGPFKRKKLHGTVGEVLEKLYADNVDEHLGELALHFLEAGNKDRALDYFLKAADKAQKVYANTEAASYYQSALKLLEEKEGKLQEKGRVYEGLGDVKRLVGECDACLKYWNNALLIWGQLNEKVSASRLRRKMANVLWDELGDAGKAKEHYDKCLKILETEPESIELASLYEDMAHMYYRVGETSEALSWAEKALELAKKLDAPNVLASSYASLGTIFTFTGETAKQARAFEYLENALKIALANGYMETALRAQQNLAGAIPTEEYERRFECFKKGYELARKVGDVSYQSWAGLMLAWYHIGRGDMGKASFFAEESVALDRRAGNRTHLPMSIDGLGIVYQVLGEWEKSEQCHKEARSILQGLNDWQALTNGYWATGWLHLERGEHYQARELFEKACEVDEKVGSKSDLMFNSRWLIWAELELGETEEAEKLIDVMQKYAIEEKDKDLASVADALKAMLRRVQKKYRESIEHFEETLKKWESIRADKWHIYLFAKIVLYEYAQAYLERDQPGDREKALNLLNRALEMFQKMGTKKDIEKVEVKIAFMETGKVVTMAKALEYVSTGNADLDKLLYGGIASPCSVVLTSPSCPERDQLIKSFVEAGAKNGEVAFFVTISPGPMKTLAEELQSNFYLFVCNPEADAIIKDAHNVFKMKGVENLTNISIALASAIRQLDPSPKRSRRVCLSLVSDVLLQHHAVETRRWLTALLTKLKSEGFTTLAVFDPEMHSLQDARAILDLFDGEINIFEKEKEKGSERYLKIKRMSDQKYMEDDIILKRVT